MNNSYLLTLYSGESRKDWSPLRGLPTDPRSTDYPMGYSTDYRLRTTPTDYPEKSTKFLLRGRKIQEPYLLFLHDHIKVIPLK